MKEISMIKWFSPSTSFTFKCKKVQMSQKGKKIKKYIYVCILTSVKTTTNALWIKVIRDCCISNRLHTSFYLFQNSNWTQRLPGTVPVLTLPPSLVSNHRHLLAVSNLFRQVPFPVCSPEQVHQRWEVLLVQPCRNSPLLAMSIWNINKFTSRSMQIINWERPQLQCHEFYTLCY